MSRIRTMGQFIKFEHTIFALPYAYLGMILASFTQVHRLPGWTTVLWVTLAMVGARSAAMALNRVIDRKIDALNPRTAGREIPRGIVSVAEAVVFIIGSLLLMGVAAWQLNPLCFELMPVAVFFLVIYSYTKRFTWACHFVLGVTDGLAPLGGWIAVSGRFHPAAFILFGAVALWIGGFDMIYGCQDVEFDRAHNIRSIPARFGIGSALTTARVVHLAAVALFFIMPLFVHLGFVYLVGVVIVTVLLFIEHSLISPKDMSKIHTAFFTVNSYIALAAFVFTLADVLIRIY